VSKKSSPFNDTHLKFTKMGSQIEKTLANIENEITSIENKDVKGLVCSVHEKKTIYVILNVYTEFLRSNKK
jgi:hypothetical protein